MTLPLPERLPLDPPPGDPAAVDDLVQRLSSAVFCLGVLETSLGGPAAAAPGWIGNDAEAAAARVTDVAGVARDSSAALWRAVGRLGSHRDLLEEVRDRIRALAAQQDEDYAVAWGRLGALPDPATAVRAADPAAVAIAEDVAAVEAARRREHAALLAEVVADARATGHVLAACSAVVGGTGRVGDAGRAVAYLALALPEWGAAELAVRGEQLAAGLLGGATPEERDTLAAAALAYADHGAFARALLGELGAEGVELLLLALGSGQYEQDSPIASVLAAALGAATPTGAASDPVGEVLGATYVRPDERYGSADVVAAGMAAVLAAGAGLSSDGLRPDTVARWAGQLLERERAQGMFAGAGAVPASWDGALSDPAVLAIGVLADAGEPGPVASLLADTEIWQTLLSRFWADGGAALGDLIAVASQAAGPSGDEAVRAGLAAIGDGLFEGDPSDREVSRNNVAMVAPALGRAVAAHVAVAVDALWVGVDDSRCLGASDALRGLGYLTVDRDAARVVGAALSDWAREQPAAVDDGPLPAVAVPSAYLAAQEYGQRLSYVLDTYEAQEAAELRAVAWDWSVGLVPHLLPGFWGTAAGVLEDYAAIIVGADGTWENGADTGLEFDAGTAIQGALDGAGPASAPEAAEIVRQAREAFARTAGALGDPAPAESPEPDYVAPLRDAFVPDAGTRRGSHGPGVTPRPHG